MFSLIKQVFIVLLSFIESLASNRTNSLSLNDEPCMVAPTLIDLNPVELKCYPFMISLDKCTASCNVLSPKIYIPKQTKDINVKVFNTIANKNEAKTMTKQCKCKLKGTTCNSHKKWNNKTCQCENVNGKIITSAKKIIVTTLAHVFMRMESI